MPSSTNSISHFSIKVNTKRHRKSRWRWLFHGLKTTPQQTKKTCKNFLTNKYFYVKIQHPRGRGIKIEIQKGQFKDLYIHVQYELAGMQTAALVSLCVDVQVFFVLLAHRGVQFFLCISRGLNIFSLNRLIFSLGLVKELFEMRLQDAL